MKIKRVFADDMRQAMRKVREEHGAEAVILSSRNVEGGVEVISAIDYDEKAVRAAVEDAEKPAPGSFRDVMMSMEAPPEQPAAASRPPRPTQSRGSRRPAERKPAPQPSKAAGGGGFSFTVGDDEDDDIAASLSFVDESMTAPQEPSRPEPSREHRQQDNPAASRIEWSQEPAMQQMREELRTLRSLFQNQLDLMEWQQMGRQNPVRASLLKQLNGMGLGTDVCRKLADNITESDDPDKAWSEALRIICKHLPVTDDDIVANGGIVAVVGPTGVGKTTTVAKLAARYALRHGKRHVALVTTDNFRIGGQDQLRSFARILGVPVHAAGDRDELASVLADLSDKHLVLIDTAGMSQRDMRLSEQFATLAEVRQRVKPYLVVSANTQLSTLMEIVRGFRRVKPVGCILSKVDETTTLGPALTAVLRARLPVAYLGTGQRVPEDLSPARSDKLVENAATLMKRAAEEADEESLALTFGGAANGYR